MKKKYFIGIGIIIVITIIFYFPILIQGKENYCEITCQEVSEKINTELIISFQTSNNDKKKGCRCEFKNGKILGFGLD